MLNAALKLDKFASKVQLGTTADFLPTLHTVLKQSRYISSRGIKITQIRPTQVES
jgi:hypothetical protein